MSNLITAKKINTLYILIQTAVIVGFLYKGQNLYALGSFVILLVFLSFIYLENRFNVRIENYIRILIMFSLILHSLVGEFMNVYNTSPVFDKALHFYGTFSFSLLIYSLIRETVLKSSTGSKLFIFILITALGTSLGTFFEIIEFTVDNLFDAHGQKGLVDTNLDMLSNIIGSLTAAAFTTMRDKIQA